MIKSTQNGVTLSIYVQPKASKTEFVGLHGDALRFRVAAPPVKGEANAVLCRYLAKVFALPQGSVAVYAGQASRKKQITLIGVNEDEVRKKLNLFEG